MIYLFGHGYMAEALVGEMYFRNIDFKRNTAPCSEYNYFDVMQALKRSPSLVINAAAYVPLPSVDLCKNDPAKTILGNVCFPQILANACQESGVPLMHLSTACLYDEQREYTEEDEPTRGWNGYCGVYVGSKLGGEHLVREYEKHYILRLRLPFDEFDHPRNYLSKLASFETVYDHVNSLTHRGDFAKWTLDLWQKNAPFGTYSCVNTGQIAATETLYEMTRIKGWHKVPRIVKSPDTTGARLSNAKLGSVIGPVRSVQEAVRDAIDNWKPKT